MSQRSLMLPGRRPLWPEGWRYSHVRRLAGAIRLPQKAPASDAQTSLQAQSDDLNSGLIPAGLA
jgi:hypothetical protein